MNRIYLTVISVLQFKSAHKIGKSELSQTKNDRFQSVSKIHGIAVKYLITFAY